VLVALKGRLWLSLGLAVLAVAGAGMALHESTDNAFYSRWGVDAEHLPYRSGADARADVAAGKARAAASGKMLMVTFGANWCPDCLTLHRNLQDPATREYAARKFEMVNIDVGDFGRNADVARDLGVDVNGIPLAVFFSADGEPICDTSRGELKPSRHYTSREILEFLREVADYRRVVSPDQRQ
jgi:thiol-disulfide isomerase/thioredoxin